MSENLRDPAGALRAALAAAERARAEASRVLGRVGAAVEAGELPLGQDIRALAHFSETLINARTVLGDREGGQPRPDRGWLAITEIRDQLARLEGAALKPLTQALSRLVALPTDPIHQGTFGAIRERATALLTTAGRWTEEERREADALDVLVRLQDARSDAEDRTRLFAHARDTLPAELQTAVVLASMSALPVPIAPPADTESAGPASADGGDTDGELPGGLATGPDPIAPAETRSDAAGRPTEDEVTAPTASRSDDLVAAGQDRVGEGQDGDADQGSAAVRADIPASSPRDTAPVPQGIDESPEDIAGDPHDQAAVVGGGHTGSGSSAGAEGASGAQAEPEPTTGPASPPSAPPVDRAIPVSDARGPEPEKAAPPSSAPPVPSVSDSELDEAIAAAARDGSYGLAYWLYRARLVDPVDPELLRAMALADATQDGASPSAAAFQALISEIPADAVAVNRIAMLLALAAAVRVMIVAPYAGATSWLRESLPVIADRPALHTLAEGIADAADRGITLVNAFDQRARTMAELTHERERLRVDAQTVLTSPGTIKFQRASEVWQRVLSRETGPVGLLLDAVLDDGRRPLEELRRDAERLCTQRGAAELIDDPQYRPPGAKAKRRIEAGSRQQLVRRIGEAADIILRWADVSLEIGQLSIADRGEAWRAQVLDDLRSTAATTRSESEALSAASAAATGVAAVAGIAAQASLAQALGLILEGQRPPGPERAPAEAVGIDLLRAGALPLNEALEPTRVPLAAELLDARSTSWEAALEARLNAKDHPSAMRIIDEIARIDPARRDALHQRRADRQDADARALADRLRIARREVNIAHRNAQLDEESWHALERRVSDLDAEQEALDVGRIDAMLNELQQELRVTAVAAAVQKRDEIEPRLIAAEADAAARERVLRALDSGDLATVEELVLAIERHEELPAPSDTRDPFEMAYPTVTRRLIADPIASADVVAQALDSGGEVRGLDLAQVRPDQVRTAADAVEAWFEMAAADREKRLRGHSGDLQALLRRVLGVLGLRVTGTITLKNAARATDPRHADIEANWLGQALVPAFGSRADHRYTVMLSWHQSMTEETILDAVRSSARPVILLHFGTLNESLRHAVADRARQSHGRLDVCLVDTATLLSVVGLGSSRFDTTMRLTLPFTAVNPYEPFVAGTVPQEMFYGRRAALEQVMERDGVSFIYGGRRLGKSALLRAAEREFPTRGRDQIARYVDLTNKGVGDYKPAENVFDEIEAAFDSVLPAAPRRTTSIPVANRLHDRVLKWLESNPEGRLLLLMDECDKFLNADAAADFRSVTEIRRLMEETGRRFKPVFAGLHMVRRFHDVSNQRLVHFGRSVAVGPLSPKDAFNLIDRPLRALGYRLEEETVDRILTVTQNQPSLIQLVCHELLSQLHARVRPMGTPPYVVSSDDIERVLELPDLTREMRDRFELTINLDSRYRVIAHVVAFLGVDDPRGLFDEADIREQCEEYWRTGFQSTDATEFASLLSEMEALGILYEDRRRYGIRSTNVLRMLGTSKQIEDALLNADELRLDEGFNGASFREPLMTDGAPTGRRSPLTVAQSESLRRPGARVELIVGSQATGIADVPKALLQLEDADVKVTPIGQLGADGDRKRFGRALTALPGRPHRVVEAPIGGATPEQVTALLRDANERVAEYRGQRSTVAGVLVVEPASLEVWRSMLGDEQLRGTPTTELKRWDAPGLLAWARSQDVDLPLYDETDAERLLEVTGGWPMLVDGVVRQRIAATGAASANWTALLEDCAARLRSLDGATELVDASGIREDLIVLAVWSRLVEFGEPLSGGVGLLGDLIALTDLSPEQVEIALRVLSALQVLAVDGSGVSAEPVLADAWRLENAAR